MAARETCEGDDMGEEGGNSTKVYKEVFDHDSDPTHEGEGEEVLGIILNYVIMICINNIPNPSHTIIDPLKTISDLLNKEYHS